MPLPRSTQHRIPTARTSEPPPPPSGWTALLGARPWVTTLWTLALAAGIAGWDGAGRWLAAQADRPIVMLPAKAPGDLERREALRRIEAEPAVASADWLSPELLATHLKGALSDPSWSSLFPDDPAWTPWVLEVEPRDPLGHADRLRAFVAARRQEGAWQMVLWDDAALAALTARLHLLRGVLDFWMALVALAGGLALARLPGAPGAAAGRTPGGAMGPEIIQRAITLALALGAVIAAWAMLPLCGGPADRRGLLLALVAAFVLAGIIGPMLRVRGQATGGPSRSTFAISVGESPDER